MRSQAIRPSRGEFYGGLVVLTVLAAVSMTRFGRPQAGWADHSVPSVPHQAPPAATGLQGPDRPETPPTSEPEAPICMIEDSTMDEALRQIFVDLD